jgi:hypothetical protein
MNDDNLLLLKLLFCDFRDSWPVWKQIIKRSLSKWCNSVLAQLSRLIVLALCVWGGYVVFLYYLQSIWVIFNDTQVGKVFASEVSPEIVVAISAVIDMELSQVAYQCVLNILLITVPVGVLLKVTGLYRLTYLNRGFVGGIFWGIICTEICAKFLPIVELSGYLHGNAVIYFLPTIGLLAGSFGLSAWLVPEFTVVFQFIEFVRERMQIIKIRDLPYHQEV